MASAVDRRWRGAQRTARWARPDERREILNGLLDHLSVLPFSIAPLGLSDSPKRAETFPCTSITLRAFWSSVSARSARLSNLAFSASKGCRALRAGGSPRPRAGRPAGAAAVTAEYKLGILREAEACTAPGEIGELLRREGLYYSSLLS